MLNECSYDENKTRRQDIEIYYSFVGKVDLPEYPPDLSDTRAKCRIGTAKFFTLLLLLYHTSVKASGMTAVVLALLVGLYFLISGLQHKSATIHCQKIAQTPPPKQDFVGRGRLFYSFIYLLPNRYLKSS